MMFSRGSKRNIAKKRVTANAPTIQKLDNTSLANVLILYPLKTPENRNFSDVFRGYRIGTLAKKRLIDLFRK